MYDAMRYFKFLLCFEGLYASLLASGHGLFDRWLTLRCLIGILLKRLIKRIYSLYLGYQTAS